MATPPAGKVNYKEDYIQKETMLKKAYGKFKQCQMELDGKCCFEVFCLENKFWLDDYALFTAFEAKTGTPWHSWPTALRLREPEALAKKTQELADEIAYVKFVQYAFFSQWSELKEFCRERKSKLWVTCPFMWLMTAQMFGQTRNYSGWINMGSQGLWAVFHPTTLAKTGNYGVTQCTNGRRCRRTGLNGGLNESTTT